MNKQRLAVLIVSGLGVMATFMPWVEVSCTVTISGAKGDGWITLFLLTIPLIIGLLNDKTTGFGFAMTDLIGTSGTISARYFKDGSKIFYLDVPLRGAGFPLQSFFPTHIADTEKRISASIPNAKCSLR